MSAKDQIEKEIREACVFLREKNQTIPSDTIQFMLDASLEKLESSVSSRGNMLVEENLSKSIERCREHTKGMSDKEVQIIDHLNTIPSLQGLGDIEKLRAATVNYMSKSSNSVMYVRPDNADQISKEILEMKEVVYEGPGKYNGKVFLVQDSRIKDYYTTKVLPGIDSYPKAGLALKKSLCTIVA